MSAPAAEAAPRSGTTSEGVRITLDGRVVSLRVPARIPRETRLTVYCESDRPPLSQAGLPQRTVRARPGRRLRLTLPRRAARADFCGYSTDTGITGAAVLTRAPSPAAVAPGPGVREARTTNEDEIPDSGSLEGDDGDAVFLAVDTRITVRLARPLRRSTAVYVACGRFDTRERLAYRAVVLRGGQRTVTVDAGAVRPDADLCLIEDVTGSDIAGALLGPPAPA